MAGRLAMRCTRSTISRVTRLAPTTNSRSPCSASSALRRRKLRFWSWRSQALVDQRADGLLARVLRHVVERAVPHRLDGDLQLLHRRGHDHGDVRVVLLDDLQHLDGADAGQRDVEQHRRPRPRARPCGWRSRRWRCAARGSRGAARRSGRRGSPRRCPRRAPSSGARPSRRVYRRCSGSRLEVKEQVGVERFGRWYAMRPQTWSLPQRPQLVHANRLTRCAACEYSRFMTAS